MLCFSGCFSTRISLSSSLLYFFFLLSTERENRNFKFPLWRYRDFRRRVPSNTRCQVVLRETFDVDDAPFNAKFQYMATGNVYKQWNLETKYFAIYTLHFFINLMRNRINQVLFTNLLRFAASKIDHESKCMNKLF